MKALLLALAAFILALVALGFALAAMETPVRLFALAAIAFTIASTWFALRYTYRPRDPLAYYASWGGYWHPIGLHRRITRQRADEIAAEGYAYLIGEYNENGQLTCVVKMLKGEVFFEYNYSYHENKMLKTARVRRGGRDVLLQWDKRGRPPPEQHNAL